jgi:hypothetical protein
MDLKQAGIKILKKLKVDDIQEYASNSLLHRMNINMICYLTHIFPCISKTECTNLLPVYFLRLDFRTVLKVRYIFCFALYFYEQKYTGFYNLSFQEQ